MQTYPPCVLAALLGWSVLALPASAQQSAPDGPCAGLDAGPVRTVARIADGETLELDDGTGLRLIGALAPRAFDAGLASGAWRPEIHLRNELAGLVLGKSIALHFGADTADRYGRLLAQVVLIEGEQRSWLQGRLLEQGLARAYMLAGHRTCANELLAAEASARKMRTGLWAEAAYQVRSAATPAELLRYRTTFQLVEGRIERVALVRGVIYLNFDRNWRRAFSASLRQADRDLLGDHAAKPKGLEGKTVRVRGWIEQRAGAPLIDVSAAGYIQILPDEDRKELRQSP